MPGNDTPKLQRMATTGRAIARLESTLARRYEAMARLIDPMIASTWSARSGVNPVRTRAGKRWASSIRKTR